MDIGLHKASLYVCTKEGSAWGCTEIRFEWHSVWCALIMKCLLVNKHRINLQLSKTLDSRRHCFRAVITPAWALRNRKQLTPEKLSPEFEHDLWPNVWLSGAVPKSIKEYNLMMVLIALTWNLGSTCTRYKKGLKVLERDYIDGFHRIFSLGNWRAVHHHAFCWLVNIHITWHFCPPVSMVKDAMESVYSVVPILLPSDLQLVKA